MEKVIIWTQPTQKHRSKWPGRTVLALMIVAITPLVWDGLKVCAANWTAMQGGYMYVETPAFEAMVDAKREVGRQAWQVLGPIVHEPPWGANTTIMLACGWVVVLMWVFRMRRT